MHFFSIKQINRTFFVKIITLFQRSLSFGNIWVILVPFVPYYFVSCVRDFMSEKTYLSIVPFPIRFRSIPVPFPFHYRGYPILYSIHYRTLAGLFIYKIALAKVAKMAKICFTLSALSIMLNKFMIFVFISLLYFISLILLLVSFISNLCLFIYGLCLSC